MQPAKIMQIVLWVNTLLNDHAIDFYAKQMKKECHPQDTIVLGAFAYTGLHHADGSPKPSLEYGMDSGSIEYNTKDQIVLPLTLG